MHVCKPRGQPFSGPSMGGCRREQGTRVTAHRALCTSWQFTEPGLICQRSGLGSLPDPRVPWDSLWPALPGGRSAAREAWTCVKLRETQAKSPRPGRNLLAENPAVGLPRAASAGRVPLCPPVGLCGHRHRWSLALPPRHRLGTRLRGLRRQLQPLCVELQRHQGALWAAPPPAPVAGTWKPGLRAAAPRIPGTMRSPLPRPPCFRGSLWTAGDRLPAANAARSLRDTLPRRLREGCSRTQGLLVTCPLHPLYRAGLLGSCSQRLGAGQTPRKPDHQLLCAPNTLPQMHTPVNTGTATRASAARAASHL